MTVPIHISFKYLNSYERHSLKLLYVYVVRGEFLDVSCF